MDINKLDHITESLFARLGFPSEGQKSNSPITNNELQFFSALIRLTLAASLTIGIKNDRIIEMLRGLADGLELTSKIGKD